MSELSGYQIMWAIVLFDIPVKTTHQRQQAHDFRKQLLEEGFIMMQYSVYIKYTSGISAIKAIEERLMQHIPGEGKISVIAITDKQYERIFTFQGKKHENPPPLTLF